MFKELGMMAGLLKQLPKIKAGIGEFQEKLGTLTATGNAGGDAVTVTVNGLRQLVQVRLGPDALADRELLEDLIVAAANQALDKVNEQVKQETAKMAEGLGIPPGMDIPGLS